MCILFSPNVILVDEIGVCSNITNSVLQYDRLVTQLDVMDKDGVSYVATE